MKKILLLLVGFYIMTCGIVLTIVAKIGVAPLGCIPYILYVGTKHLSVGAYNIIMNCTYLFLQFALKHWKFAKTDFLQLVMVCIFGFYMDINFHLIHKFVLPHTYHNKLILSLMGCIIAGLGSCLVSEAKLITMPAIGIVKVITEITHKNFRLLKFLWDLSFVIIGLILSLILCHKVVGIGEGTFITLFFIGASSRFFMNLNKFLKQKFYAKRGNLCKDI